MALTQEEIDKQKKEQDNYQAARPNLSSSKDEQVQVDNKPELNRESIYADFFREVKDSKAPEYNTRYEKQQKALMQGQSIGNMLALVGDVAGAAMGAPVKKRTFKSTEPYLQAIEDRRLQYMKDTEAFNKDKYAKQLQLMGYMKQEDQINAQAAQRDIANKRADESLRMQGEGLDLRKEAQTENIQSNKDRLAETKRQFDENMKFNKQQLTAKNAAEAVKNTQRDEKGNVLLFTDSGEQVASLNPSKVSKAFAMIQKDFEDSADLDSSELKRAIDLLKPSLGGGLSKASMEHLVQKYWNNSPKAIEFLGLKTKEQSNKKAPVDQSTLPPFLRNSANKPTEALIQTNNIPTQDKQSTQQTTQQVNSNSDKRSWWEKAVNMG